MKMETEIKAPITCTIERMLVEKGDSAEADDLLAVIVWLIAYPCKVLLCYRIYFVLQYVLMKPKLYDCFDMI